jgi:outer membrane lipoprotein SlyB
MKKSTLLCCLFFLSLYGSLCFAESAGTAAVIKYGIVQGAETVKKDASHAGGAVVGGLAAMVFARGRHKPIKVAASAAAGAAIQGAATSGTLQQYLVKLLDGNEIRVSTEQTDIRTGDCVAVERGQHVNLRRVGTVHCELDYTPKPPAYHQSSANNCQMAKDELSKAEKDEAVNVAVTKVRVLCDH